MTELLFNYDPEHALTNQALIVLDEPAEVAWPIDELNEALAVVYNGSGDVPGIFNVETGGLLVQSLNLVDDPDDTFWDVVADWGYYDGESGCFLQEMPFMCADASIPLAAVCYPRPFGPPLPLAAMNAALQTIMGQPMWPDDEALFAYVGITEGKMTALWMADVIDDFDDVVFRVAAKEIKDLNDRPGIPPGFQSRRYP